MKYFFLPSRSSILGWVAGLVFAGLAVGLRAQGVDTSFVANANSVIYGVALQPDGRFLVSGQFTTIGGQVRNRIARLNADGTVEPTNTFNLGTGLNNGAYNVAVQADGKILVTGFFSTAGSFSRNYLARLNADGTVDSGFNPGPNGTVYSLVVQPDGKILVAGDFLNIGGQARNRIARLNPNGTADTSFNPNAGSPVYGMALQTDGKIVIVGDFATVGGAPRNRIARLNADGTVEATNTFNIGSGSVTHTVYCTAVQSDGKIIIGGVFSAVNGQTRNRIARLNPDGTVEATNTFNPGSGGTGNIYNTVVQTDGKIVIAGAFTSFNSLTRNRIARLNADGTLDSTFDPNAGGEVDGTAVQADGRILIGGSFNTIGVTARTNLARLTNSTATQSLTVPTSNRVEWLRGGASPEAQDVAFDFSTDGGVSWIALGPATRLNGGWELTGLTLPASGQVRARARVTGGYYNGSSGLLEATVAFSGFTASAPIVTTIGATNITDVSATLNASVNPASSGTAAWFEYGTTTNYGSIANLTLSPTNGATLQNVSNSIAGLTPGTTYHFRAAASNSVGLTLGTNLSFTTLLYPDIVVEQPTGTNLIDGTASVHFGTNLLGTTTAAKTFTIRNIGLTNLTGITITKDGTNAADFAFDTNGMSSTLAPGTSTTFTVIFTTGSTGTRTAAIHIACNDPDENPFDITLTGVGYRAGDVESTFNPNANSTVYSLASLPSGKILVGGAFSTIGSPTRSYFARLNNDGTTDTTFNPNANFTVWTMAVQPDGKILIGGEFSLVGGVTRNRIARVNADGTLDTGFNPNAGTSVTVYNVALQPDGKILMAGSFNNIGGISRNRLARLNADGTLDLSFSNSVSSTVYAVAPLPDGRIMIGGDFSSINGVTRNYLARLNTNGTLDATFTNILNQSVYGCALQPDGKLLISGVFSTINGLSRGRVARFNTDWTLDSFDPQADNPVYSLAVQTDGKIILGGSMFNVRGVARLNLARVNGDGTLDTGFNPTPNPNSDVRSVLVQPDGTVILGGNFSTIGGFTRSRIARLFNDGVTQSLTVASANRVEWLRGGALPETAGVTFDLSTDSGTSWIALGNGSRISGGWELTNLSLPASGLIRARARTFGGTYLGSSSLIESNTAFSGFTASPPLVLTTPATGVNVLFATINASINPSGSGITAQFEYGTTTNYGSAINITLSPTNGATAQSVSAALTGLTGGTTYHFRAVASNSVGTTYGNNVTFMTLVEPEIAVEQPLGTNLIDGGSSVSFPITLLSNTGPAQTFIIRNLGVTDLTGFSITKDGAHTNDYVVDTNAISATVAPGASTTFTVTFIPTATGTRTAAIHIANNDSDENPFDITLTGTGNKAGDLDLVFNPNVNEFVRHAAIQADGKIVINGFYTSVGGTLRTNIARVNADGTLDASFNPAPDSTLDALTLESNQKILVGGFFTTISGQARTRIARLNTNGTADAALNSGANQIVSSIVPQPDGKLILCGNFTSVAGLTRNRIARLNTDGTVDTNFNPNADSSVTSALVQPDGKIIVWGNFQLIGNMARQRFARLNADGTTDGSYNPANGTDGTVTCAAMQPDGKLLVGGTFQNFAGVARSRIARLNTDGTADASFAPVANESLSSIAIQTDGKILVVGSFTSIAGATRNFIARLQTNGTIDTVFNPVHVGSISGISVQPDGKIIITGGFTSSGGQTRNRIARLINDNVSQALTVASVERVEWLRGGASPEAQRVTFDVSTDAGSSWLPLGAGTRIAGGWELTGLTLPGSGLVRAQGRMTGGSGNGASWVVESVTNFAGLPAPEIAIEQPQGTNVADDSAKDFGAVLLGSNVSLTFTITNLGTMNLTGIIVTKDGLDPGDFTLDTNGMSSVLAPGASTSFSVTFAPTAIGARSAAIHIANNDADENPFDIALSGTGVAPEIAVQQPPGTNLVDGATTNDFGSIIPGTSSAAKTFTITNSGSSTLNALTVTVDGANPGDFAVDDSGVPTSLAPGASATFSVTFTPPLAGSRSAAFHIASDDADENPFDISLTGTGLNQAPVVANPIPNQNATATLPFAYAFVANTFSDPDSAQTLTYTATKTDNSPLPAWLGFVPGTRTFSGTPAPANVGTLSVKVTATDNGTPVLATNDSFDIVVAAIAPAVTTLSASSTGSYGASLQAVINPNGLPTTAQFEYGTTTSYGSIATITLSPNDGASAQNVGATIAGLTPNVTYHFRATATNSAGGNAGADLTFVTDPPPPGLADSDFNPSSALGVLTLGLQPDGKILAGGDHAEINGRFYVSRLHPDGTSDLSWNSFNFSRSFTLMVLPDGKVLAGGSQFTVQSSVNLVRLNPNGSIDNSLNPSAFNDYVFAMALQPDGRLVVGGAFTNAFGQPRGGLARINTDGTLDPTFTPTQNGHILTMIGLPNGQFIVGGGFTQIEGQSRNFIARLNADGTLDTNFVHSAPAGVVALALQADGKILYISLWPPSGAYRLTRLHPDGAVDSSFVPVNNNFLYTVAVQTDGKILLGGDFTQMNGEPRSRIARLNPDGTLDTRFNPGANFAVLSLMLQSDGKIIAGGNFTSIGGEAHQRLARLNNDAATQSLTVTNPNRVEWLRGGASPEAIAVTFEMTTDGGFSWTSLGEGTRIVGGWEKTGFTLPPNGLVRARARVPGGYRGNCFSVIEATVPFSGFPPSHPYVTTLPATAVGEFEATLHASVNPAGAVTTAQFEYGTTTNYGSVTNITLSPNDGVSAQSVSVAVGGLTPGTHYHFRVTGTNGPGGAAGNDFTFTTLGFPEISVEQPAGTNLTDSVSTIAYGTTPVGTPLTKTFTITNLGTTNLAGLSISKNGANAAEFIVGALSTNLVAPGGSATFDVTFNPSSAGGKTAAIHIANNDADENPFDINLSGGAIAPEIIVEHPPGTGLASGFSSVDCGQTLVGVPTMRTVTVRNGGTINLILSNILVLGTDADQYTVGALTSTNLPPGSNATFVVTFNPTSKFGKYATIHIQNNDSDENPFRFDLFGIGKQPDIVVEEPAGSQLTDESSTVTYGVTPVSTPVVKTFYIKNNGDWDLTGLAVTKDGTNASDFQVSGLTSFSVYPGVTTTFDVTFNPASAGTKTATLHIASSDPDENPFDITLTGNALESPEIAVEQPAGTNLTNGASTIAYGIISTGTALTKTFTVKNTGVTDLTGLSLTKDGNDASDFTVGALSTNTLAPGTSVTFEVTFNPAVVGAKTAAIHLASNDADENPFDINLSGTGATVAEIVIEQPAGTNLIDGTSTIAYGSTLLGTPLVKTFTVTNIGAGDLTGLSLSKSGAGAADFTLGALSSTTVSPGSSATFDVTFDPLVAGTKSAVIHIASSDSNENPFDINLSGTGIGPEIAIEEPAGTDLFDGISTVTFDTPVGTPTAKIFWIRNRGNTDLTNFSFGITGPNAPDFIVGPLSIGTGPLTPGNVANFQVTFFPGTTGTRNVTLHVANNDPNENPFDINLSGTVTDAAEISVEHFGSPMADTSSSGGSSIDFGARSVGSQHFTTFTIRNLGTLDLTNISVTTDGNDFSAGSLSATTVAPGGSATFLLTFAPSSSGSKTSAVHVVSSDVDENPFDFAAYGIGVTNFAPTLTRAQTNVVVPVNSVATNYGTFGDADGDAVTLTASLGIITTNGNTWSWSYTPTTISTQTVNITVDDSHETSSVTFSVAAREAIPPTAAFVAVAPDPRTNAVGAMTLNFSEDVNGVNAADFVLTRNGSPVSLAGLAVTPISAASYTLDLSAFTATSGDYVLTLVAAGSGIVDASANALAGNASDAFSIASSSGSVNDGNLSINNAPAGGSMALTIRIVTVGGTNYIEIHDANNAVAAGAGATQVDANTIRVPAASVTNQLQIIGGPGDDHFVFDATDGCPLPPGGVDIDGGGQTLNGGDTLQIIGTFSSVQYDANSIGAGNLQDDCGAVNFSGFEPIDYTLAVIGILGINVDPLNLFAGPVTTTISALPGAGNEGKTRIGFSGGLELMEIGTLTGTLTVTGDSAESDTMVVQSVATNFAGHLVIAAQAADSILLTNTTLTLSAGKNFDVTAGSLSIGGATFSGGTVSFHGGNVAMNIGGTTAGGGANQYSRLTVSGAVVLNSSPALNLTGSYVPQPGETFTLIENDGADAIAGSFAGLPEGVNFVFNGATLHITYAGGSGNDVVLSVAAPPTINCGQNETLALGLSWDFTVPIVTANCGTATLSILSTTTNQTCGATFVATRVWLATNTCGMSTTCTQVVTIIDVTGPTIVCPSNITVECAGQIPPADFAGGSAADDGANPTIIHLGDVSSGVNPRTISRSYRATDACSNSTVCVQTIVVHDTNAPTINCPADLVVAADTNSCTASSTSLGAPIVVDNCSATWTNNAPAQLPLGVTWVTWTATDAVGNSASCTQRVTVIDVSLTITAQPQNSTNNIGTTATFAVAAVGCAELSYQWCLATNILAGETNATLTLTNLQASQAGEYAVKVSNAGGSVTSAVAVLKVNTAPVLPAQSDRTIAEHTPLSVTNAAADADIPTNVLTYQLISPPAGANIDTNGVITWTPGEEQGPGTHTFTAVAMDEGGLSTTNSFIVFVTEVNLPPTVDAMSDRTVNPGQTITFTATATDADRPTNTLSFSLLTPPSGASIDSNGLFLWRPTMAQRDTTNVIHVRVQDDGSPSLSATNSFSVIVNPLAPVILKSISSSEFDVSGTAGPDYIIMASPDLLNWTDIATNISPAIPFHFNDANAGTFSNRFYKARLAP